MRLDQYVFNAPEKNLDPPCEETTCGCPMCGGDGTPVGSETPCDTCLGYGQLPEDLCSDIVHDQQIHAVRCAWCNVHMNCGIFPISHSMCPDCAEDQNLFLSKDVSPN